VSKPGEPLPRELLERAYYNQPVWKRVVVIAAGPIVNVLIAFAILFGLSFSLDEPAGSGVEVAQVVDDSPATGKLQEGDRVVSVDGVASSNREFEDRIDSFRDQTNTHTCAGEPTDGCRATTPVEVVVERDGKQVPVMITPEYNAGPTGTWSGSPSARCRPSRSPARSPRPPTTPRTRLVHQPGDRLTIAQIFVPRSARSCPARWAEAER
jgi:membrane-associated protease RseP (regulator of RpoE activity)